MKVFNIEDSSLLPTKKQPKIIIAPANQYRHESLIILRKDMYSRTKKYIITVTEVSAIMVAIAAP